MLANKPEAVGYQICRVSVRSLTALIQESKRMASGFLGKELPGNRLRVRVPCSPL